MARFADLKASARRSETEDGEAPDVVGGVVDGLGVLLTGPDPIPDSALSNEALIGCSVFTERKSAPTALTRRSFPSSMLSTSRVSSFLEVEASPSLLLMAAKAVSNGDGSGVAEVEAVGDADNCIWKKGRRAGFTWRRRLTHSIGGRTGAFCSTIGSGEVLAAISI